MTVYLVGAGPGDPGLLTCRGAELLAQADVVIHDRLSARALLDLARPEVERIDVGKSPGNPRATQDEINALLVEHGKAGRSVVRLKGGDPFVFARGGEEVQALLDAGIAFEVVPGVTSAIAAPAYAGIPLTMRHSSTSFTVITGHEDPDKGGELDWESVARLGGTIVILMGVARLERIVERLLAGGLDPDTPVAAIRWGTRPDQVTVRATLGTITAKAIESPATIVVGEVAALDLGWYEHQPLFGRTIVVTRAEAQSGPVIELLHRRGAQVLCVPMIEIADPADGGVALREAIARVSDYDWVILTSINGAHRFMDLLRDGRALGGVKVAAIGSATADAIRAYNIEVDLVPNEFVAESMIEQFPSPGRPGARVLIPRAASAREVLPSGLRALGWEVDVVEAYRTHGTEIDEDTRLSVLDADAITFTSSSTVSNYFRSMRTSEMPPVVATIGPITSATARERGVEVHVEAEVFTFDGLVSALEDHFSRPRS